MINVAELITDPDFAQPYKVIRSAGKWINGRFETTSQTLNYYGNIQPAEHEDLEQIPEIDRTTAVLKFYCQSPNKLFISQSDESGENDGIYDIILYNGKNYKIIKVLDYSDYGYIEAWGIERHGRSS